jgi:PKD repeat protein
VGSESSETFVFTATVTDTVSYGAEVTNTVEFASENAAIGSSEAVFAIKGAPVITADFSADPLTGTVPLTVTFTDESTNATSWLWDFGDHMTSTEQNPTHTYTEVSVYMVALTVTNAAGSDTEIKQAYIVAGSPSPQRPTPMTTTLTSPDQPIFVNFDEPVITSTVRFNFTPTVTFTPTWGVAMTAQGMEASQADLYWGVTLDHEPFSETVTYTLHLLPGARTVAGADIPEGIIDTFEYQQPKRYIYLPLVMKN